MNGEQFRPRLVAAVVAAAGLFAVLAVVHNVTSGPSPLTSISQAYSLLGQGLDQAGLLPFPADEASLQTALDAQTRQGLKLQPSTTNTGQRVYQLGAVLTILLQDSHATHYLLNVDHWSDYRGTPLGDALHRIAGLPLSRQHPVKLGNGGGVPIYEQSFYFEYSNNGHTWRFTPTFQGERCVRVDVMQE